MKALAAIAVVAASVLASDFVYTCKNEALDPTTKILTANCDIGDGKGTLKPASLDLDDCYGYTDNTLVNHLGPWAGAWNVVM
ncbi:hypothetical protein LZ32DRAFT_691946 [Colletotrichum eremochloae]|nr:hypothetical protein LZ32DRAFT_691946 [Colletotrichum eremochloae]